MREIGVGTPAVARRDILTTLYFPQRSAWAARARMLDRRDSSPVRLLQQLLTQAAPEDVVVLDGAIGRREGYVDRLAAGVLNRRAKPPRVLMTDSTWSPGTLRRRALAVVDGPRTSYCVLSSEELRTFPETWGVDGARVALTPFYWTLPVLPALALTGRGVFAGGDSLRDHDSLLRAAAGVAVDVTIAARRRPGVPVPDNVTLGPTSPERFLDLMRSAAVVAVPLRPGLTRSAGQQTYLNAMALGKLVVATDAPGVRDHVDHGVTGLVVPSGDSRALAEALRWATSPDNSAACEALRVRAHHAALTRFSPSCYVRRLLQVVDALPP